MITSTLAMSLSFRHVGGTHSVVKLFTAVSGSYIAWLALTLKSHVTVQLFAVSHKLEIVGCMPYLIFQLYGLVGFAAL